MDTTLRAPFDGVVAQRYVEESQNIAAGQPIVRFQSFESINIAVDVPEAVMAEDLRREDIVALTAEFSAVPGRQFPVEIREVSQVADSVTQTFRVRLEMKAPPEALLLPGMTSTVLLERRIRSDGVGVIRIPITAVYKGSGTEPVVWVIDAQGAAGRRPIRLGDIVGGDAVVLDGIVPGERIAIAGVTQLTDGMRVRDLGDALGGPASVAPGAPKP
jgi:RND family efflux transporter MFP subunit